tara:strand:- start:203 stop:373 length:171 start_codon:yes stop_codon:yes gene_type:complete
MVDHVVHSVLLHWSKWNGMLEDVPLWSPHGAICSLIVLMAGAFLLGRYMWVTALKR